MSSKDKRQWRDDHRDLEQNCRPRKGNRKQGAPPPVVSDAPFEAEEVPAENPQAPKKRVYKSRPQKQDATAQETEEEDDKLKAFGANEASLDGFESVSTAGASTQTHRTRVSTIADSSHVTTELSSVPFPPEEGTTEPEKLDASLPSNRPPMRFDEGEHQVFPGAERVGGYGGAGHAPIAPLDDAPIAQTSVDLLARAQLVEDPVVAEVGADRTEELELKLSQEQQDKKRQKRIASGIVLFLVAVIAGIISFFVLERRNEDVTSPPSRNPTVAPTSNPTAEEPTTAPTSNPTVKPTTAPTPNPSTAPTSNPTQSPISQQETTWISLIQSKMPSTTFEDSTSPQSRALDWMLEDDYTKSLNEDHRIIQRLSLAVLYYSTNGPTSWVAENRQGWLLPSTECDWGEPDVECTRGDFVDYVNFFGDGLSGNIPREIGLLSDLTSLHLNDNNLEGSIPSEFGLMTELVQLDLCNNNNLSGRVPTELANLSNLLSLFLHNTNLSGSIPSNLCNGILISAYIDCGEIECDCCKDFNTGSPC